MLSKGKGTINLLVLAFANKLNDTISAYTLDSEQKSPPAISRKPDHEIADNA
jgi:hypothetical protein